MLANLLNLHGIDYDRSNEIRDALKTLCGTRLAPAAFSGAMPNGEIPKGSWVEIPPYQTDLLVRGSEPLQKTKDGRLTRAVLYGVRARYSCLHRRGHRARAFGGRGARSRCADRPGCRGVRRARRQRGRARGGGAGERAGGSSW